MPLAAASHPSRHAAPASARARRMRHGCTLIEALCSLTIMLVLLSGALPMLQDLIARQTLLAQAAELETDLFFARAQAQIQMAAVRFSVHPVGANGSCYIVYRGDNGACDCTGEGRTQCMAGAEVLRVVNPSRRAGITLAELDRPLTFDAGVGTVTPTATLRLTDADGRAVNQVINLMGRVRSCTPNPAWGGLRRC